MTLVLNSLFVHSYNHQKQRQQNVEKTRSRKTTQLPFASHPLSKWGVKGRGMVSWQGGICRPCSVYMLSGWYDCLVRKKPLLPLLLRDRSDCVGSYVAIKFNVLWFLNCINTNNVLFFLLMYPCLCMGDVFNIPYSINNRIGLFFM